MRASRMLRSLIYVRNLGLIRRRSPRGATGLLLATIRPSIPHLSSLAFHCRLQRHGISRQEDVSGDRPKRQKFKCSPIDFFHINIAEVQTAEEKLYLFVGMRFDIVCEAHASSIG